MLVLSSKTPQPNTVCVCHPLFFHLYFSKRFGHFIPLFVSDSGERQEIWGERVGDDMQRSGQASRESNQQLTFQCICSLVAIGSPHL